MEYEKKKTPILYSFMENMVVVCCNLICQIIDLCNIKNDSVQFRGKKMIDHLWMTFKIYLNDMNYERNYRKSVMVDSTFGWIIREAWILLSPRSYHQMKSSHVQFCIHCEHRWRLIFVINYLNKDCVVTLCGVWVWCVKVHLNCTHVRTRLDLENVGVQDVVR